MSFLAAGICLEFPFKVMTLVSAFYQWNYGCSTCGYWWSKWLYDYISLTEYRRCQFHVRPRLPVFSLTRLQTLIYLPSSVTKIYFLFPICISPRFRRQTEALVCGVCLLFIRVSSFGLLRALIFLPNIRSPVGNQRLNFN